MLQLSIVFLLVMCVYKSYVSYLIKIKLKLLNSHIILIIYTRAYYTRNYLRINTIYITRSLKYIKIFLMYSDNDILLLLISRCVCDINYLFNLIISANYNLRE